MEILRLCLAVDGIFKLTGSVFSGGSREHDDLLELICRPGECCSSSRSRHARAQPARPFHLLPVERGHLLFDSRPEGLHMRVPLPALWADEVIGPARAHGELNWDH